MKQLVWLPQAMLVADVLNKFGGLKGLGADRIQRSRDALVIKRASGDVVVRAGDLICQGEDGHLTVRAEDTHE